MLCCRGHRHDELGSSNVQQKNLVDCKFKRSVELPPRLGGTVYRGSRTKDKEDVAHCCSWLLHSQPFWIQSNEKEQEEEEMLTAAVHAVTWHAAVAPVRLPFPDTLSHLPPSSRTLYLCHYIIGSRLSDSDGHYEKLRAPLRSRRRAATGLAHHAPVEFWYCARRTVLPAEPSSSPLDGRHHHEFYSAFAFSFIRKQMLPIPLWSNKQTDQCNGGQADEQAHTSTHIWHARCRTLTKHH